MHIDSFSITNARKITRLSVRDIPLTGVFLITGDNEAGKSTIMDCLRELWATMNNSNKEGIRSLQPLGRDVGPSVRMDAELGTTHVTVFKQWLRQRKTELTVKGERIEQFTGREADERFFALLDKHFDKELRNVLFVEQGQLDRALKANGLPRLRDVLSGADEAKSHQPGAERSSAAHDDALLNAARKEFMKYYTLKKREPTGEFKECAKKLEEARQKLRASEDKVLSYRDNVETFKKYTVELKDIDDRLPQEIEKLRQLEEKLRAVDRVAERWEQAKNNVEAAKAGVLRAVEVIENREKLHAEVAERKQHCERLREKAAEREARVNAVQKTADAIDASIEEMTKKLREVWEDSQRMKRVRDALDARDTLRERESTLQKIADIDEELRSVIEGIPRPIIEPDDWKQIADAEQELTVRQRVAEETAAKLILSAEVPVEITVDGAPTLIEGDHALSLRGGMSLEHAGLRMTYQRGGSEQSRDEDPVRAAEDELARALSAVGCTSVDNAKERYSLCQAAEEKRAALRKDRLALLGQATREQLEEELAEAQRLWDDADLSDEECALTLSEVKGAVEAAERMERELTEKRESLREELKGIALEEKKTALIRAETELRSQEEEREREESRLALAEEQRSLEALRSAHADAQSIAAQQQEVARELEKQYRELNPETLTDDTHAQQDTVTFLSQTKSRLDRGITELGVRIEAASGEEEERDKAASQVYNLETVYRRMARNAEAATLLYDTLLRHQQALHDRYSEPLREKMNAMARRIFGTDTQVQLDEDLAVSARTTEVGSIRQELLSGGAQEQLALIQRLSIAELLQERSGEIPPIFMDDVLGNSDATRLSRMSQLIKEAGSRGQVFILTCYPRRYEAIGGVYTLPIDKLMGEGMSLSEEGTGLQGV